MSTIKPIPVFVSGDRERQIGTLEFDDDAESHKQAIVGEVVALLRKGALQLGAGFVGDQLVEVSILPSLFQRMSGAGFVSNVGHCARCGEDHVGIWFEQLDSPIPDSDDTLWTHWSPCPKNGQPILLREGPSPAPQPADIDRAIKRVFGEGERVDPMNLCMTCKTFPVRVPQRSCIGCGKSEVVCVCKPVEVSDVES